MTHRFLLCLLMFLCVFKGLIAHAFAQGQRQEERATSPPRIVTHVTPPPPSPPPPPPLPPTPPQSVRNSGPSSWDIDKVTKHLQDNARSKSGGDCAQFTRQAIEAGAGGRAMTRTLHAKDYGPSLVSFGFREHSSTEIKPMDFKKGDVVVIQATKVHASGHMAMYDGKQWISDFKQRDHWGGSIRDSSPSYKVYRLDPTASGNSQLDSSSSAPTRPTGSGLGGVLINPVPRLKGLNSDGSAASDIVRDRPSVQEKSWRIELPLKGEDHGKKIK